MDRVQATSVVKQHGTALWLRILQFPLTRLIVLGGILSTDGLDGRPH